MSAEIKPPEALSEFLIRLDQWKVDHGLLPSTPFHAIRAESISTDVVKAAAALRRTADAYPPQDLDAVVDSLPNQLTPDNSGLLQESLCIDHVMTRLKVGLVRELERVYEKGEERVHESVSWASHRLSDASDVLPKGKHQTFRDGDERKRFYEYKNIGLDGLKADLKGAQDRALKFEVQQRDERNRIFNQVFVDGTDPVNQVLKDREATRRKAESVRNARLLEEERAQEALREAAKEKERIAREERAHAAAQSADAPVAEERRLRLGRLWPTLPNG